MSSIFASIFGGGSQPAAPAPQQQQQPPQQQTQPGNIPPAGGATAPNNPTVPAGQETTETAPAAPLAEFADLWQPPKDQGTQTESMFATVDPKKLMEAAQKTDFSKAVSPQVLAAIKAGGEEGIAASMQAMNTMAQTVYANSAMATTKIVEQALAKQMESFKASLPQIIKQHSLSDNLRSENPAFSNPAVQPFIQAMEAQLAVKHPGATATELTNMAKQYIEGIGSLFSPAPAKTAAETAKAGETDWSKFF